MRGRAVLIGALTLVAGVGLAQRARAQEVTTTTILPIFVPLHLGQSSGPAGTEVSVEGGMCDAFRGGQFVTVSFDDADQQVAVDAEGAWSTTVTIPSRAEVGDVFTIHARCANSETTVFVYADATFTVAAPVPEPTTSTTEAPASTATTPTTITSPPLGTRSVNLVDPTTTPTTGDPTTQLPSTGSRDATGLTVLALALVAAGGLLLARSRRR